MNNLSRIQVLLFIAGLSFLVSSAGASTESSVPVYDKGFSYLGEAAVVQVFPDRGILAASEIFQRGPYYSSEGNQLCVSGREPNTRALLLVEFVPGENAIENQGERGGTQRMVGTGRGGDHGG